jgi:hypothetical protein
MCWLNEVIESKVAELHYSAISQVLLWFHFVFETACSKKLARPFLCKSFTET